MLTVYGYEPVVVTTCPPEASLKNGLVFCRIKSWLTGRRFVSLPFSDHCEPLVDSTDDLDAMLLHMQRDLDERKWQYIEIRPISQQTGSQVGLEKTLTYQYHRLDLRKSAQELFHGFHKDCVKRKIRRAEREELKYEDGNSEALLQKFYRLQVTTRRRQYLPPQPLAWFRGLIATFGDDLKIRVASKGDLPVASILTLSNKRCVVYKYGGSIASLNKLGGWRSCFGRRFKRRRKRRSTSSTWAALVLTIWASLPSRNTGGQLELPSAIGGIPRRAPVCREVPGKKASFTVWFRLRQI